MRFLFFFLILFTGSNLLAQSKNLSPKKFQEAIAGDSIQLLDVRTYEEYISGYIGNTMLADWKDQETFKSTVESLDKTKPVYIYCRSGARSAEAQRWMMENGFTSVINLKGGILAWEEENLEITIEAQGELYDLENTLKRYPMDKKVLVAIDKTYNPSARKMKPIVDGLIKEGNTLVVVDGDAIEALQYSVYTFPTFIVFENGKEISRKEGVATKEELKKLVE